MAESDPRNPPHSRGRKYPNVVSGDEGPHAVGIGASANRRWRPTRDVTSLQAGSRRPTVVSGDEGPTCERRAGTRARSAWGSSNRESRWRSTLDPTKATASRRPPHAVGIGASANRRWRPTRDVTSLQADSRRPTAVSGEQAPSARGTEESEEATLRTQLCFGYRQLRCDRAARRAHAQSRSGSVRSGCSVRAFRGCATCAC